MAEGVRRLPDLVVTSERLERIKERLERASEPRYARGRLVDMSEPQRLRALDSLAERVVVVKPLETKAPFVVKLEPPRGEPVASVSPKLALAERVRREWARDPNVPLAQRLVPDDGTFVWLRERLAQRLSEMEQLPLPERSEVRALREMTLAALRTVITQGNGIEVKSGKLPYVRYVKFAIDALGAFGGSPKMEKVLEEMLSGSAPAPKDARVLLDQIAKNFISSHADSYIDHVFGLAPTSIIWPTRESFDRKDFLHHRQVAPLVLNEELVWHYDAWHAPYEIRRTPRFYAETHDVKGHFMAQYEEAHRQAHQLPFSPNREWKRYRHDEATLRFIAKRSPVLGSVLNELKMEWDHLTIEAVTTALFLMVHEQNGFLTYKGMVNLAAGPDPYLASRMRENDLTRVDQKFIVAWCKGWVARHPEGRPL